MAHETLLLATLSDPLYPSGLVVGCLLILLLVTREFLDAASSVRLERWERAIRIVSIPLTLIFVVSVAARIAG